MFNKNKRTDKMQNYENKLLSEETPFAITEAFKTLRANLYYTSKNEACPVFAITSAHAHAGKSVIIANTALSYAQLDKRVLLIDGDMRCPVINKIFGQKSEPGLSELLASPDTDSENFSSFLTPSGTKGLDLITSGRIPPNPSELLSSPRFKEFINSAKKNYDFIFIDLPPICEVADAGVISASVTGYLFAVRSGAADTKTVSSGLNSLKQSGANVVGFVLNDVDLKTNKYYKYRSYSRGYASDKPERNKKNNIK